jgi:putative CocE/NonD family hydrolase
MSLQSWGVARLARLGPPLTRKVQVDRGLRVPMGDGVICLADRYAPPGGQGLPVVLIRTPYGRAASRVYAEVFAARGYQVVVQECRGTFGSGGQWRPFRGEREDGLATVEWLRHQPWFGGTIGMYGPSYMGFVQWAIAADCPEISALAMQVTASRPRDMMYPGGVFSLRTMLAWTHLVGSQASGVSPVRIAIERWRKVRKAYGQVPLADADHRVLGNHFPFFQELLASEAPGAPLWAVMDFSHRVADVTAPVHMLTGWYDIFLLGQVADYRRLRQAGRQPQLVVGPWGHTSPGSLGPTVRESVRFFGAHLRGTAAHAPGDPVRVYLMGAGQWIGLPDWPPPARGRRLYLHPGGRLTQTGPVPGPADRYRFDPRDPTPDLGGTADPGYRPRDNRKVEARPDVLGYTYGPLDADIDVAGQAAADLFVRSSLPHTDFFARLCDVSPRGKSRNVCDGIARISPGATEPQPDGTHHVRIDLWPTAYRFKKGHRLRLLVASCSHPRFARNLGSGEPIASATSFRAADQEVFHDPQHPSALVIPVLHPGITASRP